VTAAITLAGIGVTLGGRRILVGVSLAVAPGEILGVLGPSGSGKTTLLRLVLGLETPDVGEVRLDGGVASRDGRILVPPELRGLGVVFQDLALWPHLSVVGNLEFGLAARGLARQERRERTAAMLSRVGLAGFERRRPGELSGGERQRVAIARALATRPRAVLFDEPLASLDAVLRAEMLGLFGKLLRERGTAAIYVTHDARELVGLADRVAVLEAGRIVQEGALDELRRAPATPFVHSVLHEEERR
jgi:ABC-type Fe3+/spermidine/putrescine transport system ATPase subunit